MTLEEFNDRGYRILAQQPVYETHDVNLKLEPYLSLPLFSPFSTRKEVIMKQLQNIKTVEKASTADIEKYIVPAYLETFAIEKTSLDFSREDDRISNKRLYFNIHEYQLTNRRTGILDGFLEQIADSLNLKNNESVDYGEVYNANGIGNNVRLPIIVNTPEKEIQFGYLNANHDMFCNVDFQSLK